MAITSLPISANNHFWPTIKAAVIANGMSVFSDNGLIYVAMRDSVKMVPFVRNKEELFSKTIKDKYKSENFRVIINGQFYDVTQAGILDALAGSDPVDPKHTTPEGLVVQNGSVIGGRPAPQMFYVANNWQATTKFSFGSGKAPANSSSAVGGCGPIIIKGLPYGKINKYSAGVTGKTQGQPTPAKRQHLVQRSNNTFAAYLKRPPYTGKTILAYHSGHKVLFAMILPHGGAGISLPDARDKLLGIGVDNAVFLDGSDSSLLAVDGRFLVSAGPDKNETNIVGIGFKF